ncbi:MAG: hypothetical protein JW934_06670 [Anaerolineae bacterium]|nr:hypothetical protein [Anaerolineae bacterium]
MSAVTRIIKSILWVGMAGLGVLLAINLLRGHWLLVLIDFILAAVLAGLYLLLNRAPHLSRWVALAMCVLLIGVPLGGAFASVDLRAIMAVLSACAVLIASLSWPVVGLALMGVEAAILAWFSFGMNVLSPYVPAAFVTASAMIYLIARSLNEATAQAESAQRDLSERNAQLEQTLHELTESVERQERLLDTIRALQTPLIESERGEGVLVVVGFCDAERIVEIQNGVFSRLQQRMLRRLIVDVSGARFDPAGLDRLAQMLHALRLIVSEIVISGMATEYARQLAQDHATVEQLRQAVTFVHSLQGALVD